MPGFVFSTPGFIWSRSESRRSESLYITTMADKMNFKMRLEDGMLEPALSSIPTGAASARAIKRSGQDKERRALVRS